MIKGGFQGLDISGVDLTAQSPSLPGAYAACAAADGKPIRVLTADGAVQCSVKKVSTNYVLAGVTGDGKILSITIGSTDVIAVSETVIPSGEEPDYTMGAKTDLMVDTYNSTSPFTVPADGMVLVTISNNFTYELTQSMIVMCKVGTSSGPMIAGLQKGQDRGMSSAFVKKGMKIWAGFSATDAANDYTSISYRPFVAE